MSDVVRAHAWTTNGHMLADVARLGYFDGSVLDATYGEGTFWNEWRPEALTTNDLYKPADFAYDYTALPWAAESFDAVVFDPPYKLTGTPRSGQKDERYGTEKPMKMAERRADIVVGALCCFRVARERLLVKCQDQVACGQMQWQTRWVTDAIEAAGGRLADRFDYLYAPQPQRSQVHARSNYSTLLVFVR